MVHVSTTDLRCQIGAVVSKAEFAKERTVVQRRGKAVAAIVPIEDLELLDELEDRLLIEAADRAEAESAGKPRIPWEQVKKELGL